MSGSRLTHKAWHGSREVSGPKVRAGATCGAWGLLATAVTALAIVFIGSQKAEASHDYVFPVLSTSSWAFCTDINTSGASDGYEHARSMWQNNTVLNISTVPSCAQGANAEWRSGQLVDSWYGFVTCQSQAGDYCNFSLVEINDRTIGQADNPTQQYNKTSCHEMGHVGGLGHRSNTTLSCMVQGSSPPISTVPDSHDMDAMDLTYN